MTVVRWCSFVSHINCCLVPMSCYVSRMRPLPAPSHCCHLPLLNLTLSRLVYLLRITLKRIFNHKNCHFQYFVFIGSMREVQHRCFSYSWGDFEVVRSSWATRFTCGLWRWNLAWKSWPTCLHQTSPIDALAWASKTKHFTQLQNLNDATTVHAIFTKLSGFAAASCTVNYYNLGRITQGVF